MTTRNILRTTADSDVSYSLKVDAPWNHTSQSALLDYVQASPSSIKPTTPQSYNVRTERSATQHNTSKRSKHYYAPALNLAHNLLICERTGLGWQFVNGTASPLATDSWLASYSCNPLFLGPNAQALEHQIQWCLRHTDAQLPTRELLSASIIYGLTKPGKQVLRLRQDSEHRLEDLLVLHMAQQTLEKDEKAFPTSKLLVMWRLSRELRLGPHCAALNVHEAQQSTRQLAGAIDTLLGKAAKVLKDQAIAEAAQELAEEREKAALAELLAAETEQRKIATLATADALNKWTNWLLLLKPYWPAASTQVVALSVANKLPSMYPTAQFLGAGTELLARLVYTLEQAIDAASAVPTSKLARLSKDQFVKVKKLHKLTETALAVRLESIDSNEDEL